MILYTENPKVSIRKLLELISVFSKVAGYKINTQKSLAFLYTINEKSERENKESIPFTIATKRIKFLGINLPKETKELYTENYKILMKKIKDDIIQYIENPKDSIRKLLELISEFSKVAGYSINYRYHLHFYILTMKNQKEKLRNQYHSPLQQKELNI